MKPMDIAMRLLKAPPQGPYHGNPSFEYYGTIFDRDVGLVSYDSSQEGVGRVTVPMYKRDAGNYRHDDDNTAQVGQWAPFHGFDIEGKHAGIKNWFVKPNIGLGEQYDETAGSGYGHPRLRGLAQWLDANPPEYEEEQEWDTRAANQWMMDKGAELMDPAALGALPDDYGRSTVLWGEPMDLAWRLLKAKKEKPFHGYNPKKHSKKGGLNAKGRAAAKRKTGANLKPPVTTKPSKLKPGSKKAKRRKSFCARMTGVKGPTSKKGKLTPKGASLKRWNC